MNNTKKQKQIETITKIIGALVVAFFVGPFIFVTIKGLVGLIIAVAIAAIAFAMLPWFSRAVANWRLKAIKAEAAQNPIETLQNEYASRQGSLETAKTQLSRFASNVSGFKEKLDGFKKTYPQDSAKFDEQLQNMQKRLELGKLKYRDAQKSLSLFESEIERAKALWSMAQAAAEMSKAAGVDMDDFYSKISTETALESVQESMGTAFADLEISLIGEEPKAPVPQESPKGSRQIPIIKTAAKAVVVALAMVSVHAQTNLPTFIKGTMDIRFDTRTQKDKVGVVDKYNLNVNVANSVVFTGGISYTPLILNSLNFVSQSASLDHDVNCDVVNPNNPAQRKSVGRIFGRVPIAQDGVYHYKDGTLGISSGDRSSKFEGSAKGRPLIKKTGFFERAKNAASIEIKRMVNGNSVALAIKNYDKLSFDRLAMAAGPVGIYPEAIVTGEMTYDYDRLIWFFENVQISYGIGGRGAADRLTGNIRYEKTKNEYVFDVRVNEPPVSEASAFSAASDESSFFATDSSIPSLIGTMKYRDTAVAGTVTASQVSLDLQGVQLSKVQTMNLFKLIILVSIVPFNAE